MSMNVRSEVSEPVASMSMNESIDCFPQGLGLLPNPINRDTQHQDRQNQK
jgi:hypothetical protein